MDIEKKLTTLRDFVNRVLDVVYSAPRNIIKIYNIGYMEVSDKDIVDEGIVVKYYHYIRISLIKIHSLDDVEYAVLTGKIFKSLGADDVGLNDTNLKSAGYCRYKINLDDIVNKINSLNDYSDEELKLWIKLS